MISQLRKLIWCLPKGDSELANNFLNVRDFESLLDLVSSAIYKVKKYRGSDKYSEVDLKSMYILKSELILYMDQLSIPDNIDEDENIEEIENEEEYC